MHPGGFSNHQEGWIELVQYQLYQFLSTSIQYHQYPLPQSSPLPQGRMSGLFPPPPINHHIKSQYLRSKNTGIIIYNSIIQFVFRNKFCDGCTLANNFRGIRNSVTASNKLNSKVLICFPLSSPGARDYWYRSHPKQGRYQ